MKYREGKWQGKDEAKQPTSLSVEPCIDCTCVFQFKVSVLALPSTTLHNPWLQSPSCIMESYLHAL